MSSNRVMKKIPILVLAAGVIVFARTTLLLAANETFIQEDWAGGESASTAIHPTNQTDWNKYSPKDEQGVAINTSITGRVTLSTMMATKLDDADADFKGTLDSTLERAEGKIQLKDGLTNPFVTGLGQLTTQIPPPPSVGSWASYAKVGNYIYSIWTSAAQGSRNVYNLWKYDIENEKWEPVAKLPKNFGPGNRLIYTGGDYLYALRGNATKEFWRYTLPTVEEPEGSWVRMADVTYNIGYGSGLAYVGGQYSNWIYCTVGSATTNFLRYSIADNTWETRATVTRAVSAGSDLIYPGSGEYLYTAQGGLNNGENENRFYRYNFSTNLWSSAASQPWPVGNGNYYGVTTFCSNIVYPGTGNYIYAWRSMSGYTNIKDFARYDITSNSWTILPDLPMYSPERSTLYYPGTGTNICFLGNRHYGKTWKFDTNTLKWDVLASPSYLPRAYRSQLLYPGSGNYIYYAIGGNSGQVQRYAIDANKWQKMTGSITPVHYGGGVVYDDGYIYAMRGAGTQTFGRAAISDLNLTWAALANTPATVNAGGYITAPVTIDGAKYIYALRGGNTTTFWQYSITGNSWTAKANTPASISEGGALYYPGAGDYIYALRGLRTSSFYRYTISTNTWETLSNCSYAIGYSDGNSATNDRFQSQLIGSGDYLYIVPPYNNSQETYSRPIVRYSINAGTWEVVGSAPPFILGAYIANTIAGDNIYVLSNSDWGFYRFSISAGQWIDKRIHSTSSFQYGNILCPDGDTVYFMTGPWADNIRKYSISQNKWLGYLKLPFTFSYGTKSVYPGSGDYFYVSEGSWTKRFWKYDFVHDTWTQLTDVPYAFCYTSQLTASGNLIYAAPGPSTGNLKFLRYTIDTDTWDELLPFGGNYIRSDVPGNTMVYPGTGDYVYILNNDAGYNLYRYSINQNAWSSGASVSWLTANGTLGGACLYYPGTGDFLYANHGRNTNDFAKYSMSQNAWTNLSYLPRYAEQSYTTNFLYPGTGDFLYALYDGSHLAKYSISTNQWDEPNFGTGTGYPVYAGQSAEMVSIGDGDTFYLRPGGETYDNTQLFYKYSVSTRTFTSRASTPAADTNSVSVRALAYPGTGDYIYATRGINYNDFWRYSISTNSWSTLNSAPATFLRNSAFCATPVHVYALRGQGTNTFWRYTISSGTWDAVTNITATVYSGARLLYPGSGDYVYALRGYGTGEFYRYSISGNSWTALTSLPVLIGYLQADSGPCSAMEYPGFGDYIYVVAGSRWSQYPTYTTTYYGPYFLRYSIANNTWEELPELPSYINSYPSILYPGKGDSLYIRLGYGHYNLYRFNFAKFGEYTSEIKEIGKNAGYNTMSWQDNTLGKIDMRARSGSVADMQGAASFTGSSIRAITKGTDLTNYATSITDKHKYFQYNARLFTDDLAKLPELDSVTINYDYFPHKQEFTSSAYNSTYVNNRLMKLFWTETQLPGTDIRFQLRTAANNNGSPGTWSPWYGPTGTSSFNYEMDSLDDYSMASDIELSNGVARLKQIYTGFAYTQRVKVTNNSGQDSADLIVGLVIDSSNQEFWTHVKPDGSDVRFVDEQGNLLIYNLSVGYGLFDYANKSARILIKVGALTNGTSKIIYLKYGNPDAISESDTGFTLDNLIFGSGGVIDSSQYDYYGVYLYSSNEVRGNYDATNWNTYFGTKSAYKRYDGFTFTFKMYKTNGGCSTGAFYGLKDSTASLAYTSMPYAIYIYTSGCGGAARMSVRENNNSRVDIAVTANTWYEGKIVLKANAGATYYYRQVGTVDWILLYDSSYSSETDFIPFMTAYSGWSIYSYAKDWNINGMQIGMNQQLLAIEEKTTSPSLSGWDYRHKIKLDNSLGSVLTNYQVFVTLDKQHEGFWSRCKDDGTDARFVDSDNTTVLTYYRQSFDYANKRATFVVNIPSIPAFGSKEIYLYYGRADASDASSFDNTFTKDFNEQARNVSAVSLDGIDDGITIPHSAPLDITNNITLEAQVKYIADEWLPGFGYRKKVTLDNTAGQEWTDIVAQFDVAFVTGKMKADYSDIRFLDTDGTKLSYRITSYDGAKATVLVKIPALPGNSTKEIYLYYGNAAAISESDATLTITWETFDTLDMTNKWSGDITGFSIGNGELKGTNTTGRLTSRQTFTAPVKQVVKFRIVNQATNGTMVAGFYKSSSDNFGFLQHPSTDYYRLNGSWVSVGNAMPFNVPLQATIDARGDGTIYAEIKRLDNNTITWSATVNKTISIHPIVLGRRYDDGNTGQNYEIYWDAIVIDGSIDDSGIVLTPTFSPEESQPAIDKTIIGKDGAYELKFTQSGLSGFINGAEVVSAVAYSVGTFMHTALTYDGENVRLYVDGTEKASAPLSGAINTNSNNIVVGQGIKGAIDELRIWNIARSANDINRDQKKNLFGNEPGLVMYLNCNENTGTTLNNAQLNPNTITGTLSGGAGWLYHPFVYSNEKPNALYHMDTGASTTPDGSGNGNTLTLNAASWSSTELTGLATGQSINFDGLSSFAQAADSPTLDLTDAVTIEAWVKPTSVQDTHIILTKGDDSQNRRNYCLYQLNDKVGFSFYNNGYYQNHLTTTSVLSAGEVTYLAAIYNQTAGVVKIYANGVEKYSGNQTLAMLTNDDTLKIGKSTSGNFFYGNIDEVRVYNRALSADEILTHYEHRQYTTPVPINYYNYEPAAAEEVGVYPTTNPVVQEITGVFYTAKNIAQFSEISNKPYLTEIKYQLSPDGYNWYWFDSSAWVRVTGGYSQANTATEVNTNLAAFQNAFASADFYWRAYLNTIDTAFATPSLDRVGITLVTGESFYVDPAGATAINPVTTDADSDQWFQYKALLYSEGQETPILDTVSLEYIKAYITVNSPNGGETLAAGSSQTITWASQGITGATGKVKLEYSTDSGVIYKPIATGVTNSGTYNWTVPDDPSQNVLVKITAEDFPVVSDVSNAVFKILSLEVNSPNGAEIWEQGKTHNVTWTSTGAIPNNLVKIEYSRDNGATWSTITNPTPNDGVHPWVVPQTASDVYLVRISSPSKPEIMDVSNAVFSVVPVPAISITQPAGNEQWKVGSQQNISWQTNHLNFSSTVDLEYSTDDFADDIQTIATGLSIGTPQGAANNDDILGTYAWSIPDSVSSAVKVRVREASVPQGRDTQTAVIGKSNIFSIIGPSITVTAPVSSDIWVVGDTHNITWTFEGVVSNDLLLEYSINGTNWELIADHEANDGIYSWVIPAGAAGDNVTIRITDNSRPTVQAVAPAFKVLSHATVKVLLPNGGEKLTIGTGYNITWQSWGQKLDAGGADYNSMSVYYSVDNGQNWTVIGFRIANTGSVSWNIPDAETTQGLIKVVDENDNQVVDTSDANFEIVLPTVTLISPNGGEILYATSNRVVSWSSTGSISNNLKLEYSTNNGASWVQIASGETNDGAYDWSVADVNTDTALVRITDTSRPTVSDVSDAVFSIRPPELILVTPNGAEEWAVGTEHEISWASIGGVEGAISDNLSLQYSTNSGSTWQDIAVSEMNDGVYLWTIPDDVSNNCRIKIFDASRVATADTSDANFKITLPFIEVLTPNGGETWPIGTQQAITWRTVGTISDNLTLEYSIDNFVTLKSIATGQTNDGTYTWTVPDDYSATVKVRVTDGDRTEITDNSNSFFSIANPIVNLTKPNGGELWSAGDTEAITWANTGTVGNSLKIEYSKNNFASAGIPIANDVPNTGSYNWLVPTDLSATVRVRVTDNTRPAVWDKSDASFTILPAPAITITSPNGGELWRVGEQKDITWSDNGGLISNNLTLQYSVNNGSSWKPIASSIANSGKYTWQVPDEISVFCLIRIIDATRPTTTDTSDEVFTITDPLITITSPNGGEIWAVSDRAPVTWATVGAVSDSLVLEFSPDGGSTYYFVATVSNSGTYTWTVPDYISSNCLFRIKDAMRPVTTDVSDRSFVINPAPTITITTPNGSEEYTLGEEHAITWTWTGLSISNNLVIESSNDNFVSTRQVIATGVPNTGSYNWVLTGDTLTGKTLKIRITDGSRTEITDISDGYFRIKGGFTVTAPNGSEMWGACSPQVIRWSTRGSVTRVKLDYSIDNGSTWTIIASAVNNIGSYNWQLPDVQTTDAKIRVSDADDDTVYDENDSKFSIVYFTARFNVMDYDTLQHLQDFGVSEPTTNWTDSGLSSPLTRELSYPYGTYTTFFTKTSYIDNSVTWTTPKEGSTPYILTVYLENSASAQVTWESILTYSYSPADDNLNAVGSLQRKGKLVGVTDLERADMGGASLVIYEPDGTTIRKTLSATTPNSSGMYTFTYASTTFEAGKVYPATLAINYRGKDYVSSANLDVGAEILQYQFFTETAKNLGESVQSIQSSLNVATAQTRTDIEASRQQITTDLRTTEDTVKTHVSSVLSAAETALKTQVDEARQQTITAMKSEILNTESAIQTGDTLIIRYRTYTGLMPKIDIYNAKNVLKVSKGTMTENSNTGIYEYTVKFVNAWGKGDFTIVCSEDTKGTLDALVISVIDTDIEEVYGQVSAVLGSTSGLGDIKTVADTLNNQFSIIETSLSKIGKDMIDEVKSAASSAQTLEPLFNQLSIMAKTIKQMTGEAGMSLEKLYEISSEKKEDIIYLKNKTQELKAAMEMSKKMVDNIAHKPVTQTWYEYK